MKVLKKIILSLVIFALAFGAFAVGYYFSVTNAVVLSDEKLALPQKSVYVYDGEDKIANLALSSFSQTVNYEDIPDITIQTFVNVEDKRFFSHNGFDTKRILKALINNLRSRSFKEGASTISQQLIKNTHLSQEKTLKRKLKEWKLTRLLEKKYTKKEILERYLNVIYFGHNCFGISSAARFYFNKTPSELDLADSVILAGLVKSPNNYSPFKNPQKCQKRKQTVLSVLQKNGVITEKEKATAMAKELPLSPKTQEKTMGYAHFVFDELEKLAERNGFTVGGKVEIYTFLNEDLQRRLEEISAETTSCDRIFSVLDTEKHGYTACVSSVGELRRSPASLIKPLCVYAPAFEENILSPATPILDEQTSFSGYAPKNYDGTFHGYVSARECLAQSLNIPAVKTLNTLGVEKAAKYLKKLGLEVEKADRTLALALGGMSQGFSLHDLMRAYCAFPNGGKFGECGFIRKIVIDGQTAYVMPTSRTRAFGEDTAYLTTDILKTAAKTGTAKKLKSLPFDVAAKTGTAGSENGNTDAYALSYTTKDVVGVWLGNHLGMLISHTGGGLPCNYLLEINRALHAQRGEIPPFTMPKSVRQIELDAVSYYATQTLCLADEKAPPNYKFTEVFKTTAIPTKKCDIFSVPRISTPTIEYSEKRVKIRFNDTFPTFYKYKITRSNYASHTTLYYGNYLPEFVDESVKENGRYVYTVTPVFNGVEGKPVTLPLVNTKQGEEIPKGIPKEWWRD